MLHWIEKEAPVKIYLDIRERILYKRIKPSCKESFLGRERDPQRTPNSFFAGFFIKPQRVTYQDLPKASLLPLSTESWQKKERRCRIYKEEQDLTV
jgi:hypothetical protein